MMYANDQTIVAENKLDIRGALDGCKDVFKKHDLRMSPGKTVMWVGQQREELNISLEGWRSSKGVALCTMAEYLPRTGVRRYLWVQVGANVWRKVVEEECRGGS